MGTHQELTTEQVELLLIIENIEEFDKTNPGNIPNGGVKEILDTSNVMDPDKFNELAQVLEYYGYLHRGDELTIDGKQYLALFKEYLKEKTNNPLIVHKSFTLINIENLKADIEASLGKISFAVEFGELSKLFEKAGQAIKKLIHR